MTMFLYPEQTICSNVTYGLLSTTFFANKKSLRDLSGHTVIIVTDELANGNLSRAAADIVPDHSLCSAADDYLLRQGKSLRLV